MTRAQHRRAIERDVPRPARARRAWPRSPTLRDELCARDRRPPPRRVHGAHPERRRAARPRPAGPRAGHRRLLPRLHQDAGRGNREPRAAASGCSTTTARRCDLWMAVIGDRLLHEADAGVGDDSRCRARACRRTCSTTTRLDPDGRLHGHDARLPERGARRSTARTALESLVVAPLVLPTRNLGWVALSAAASDACEAAWRRALLEAMARQATLALHQSRLARAEPRRGAAPGGARRTQPPRARHPRHARAGLRRHPDAAAGGAARRRTHAAAGSRAQPRHRGGPRPHAHGRSAPIGRRAAAAGRRRRRPRRRARAHDRPRAAHHRRAGRAAPSTSCRRFEAASSARSSASPRRR